MCDCFHLAFPNWHGPGTGAGRRLRGPEREAEDDSVCEEPTEFVEGERPRPQGSSPIEEFPAAEKYTEKQGENDFYDPLHKTGSGKKGKKVGFGSLFDKRSSGKMSQMEELQNGESEVLVKTAKEACAEGLVVTGGGKDGIFIKEVKPDSPASKHLSVKEGDQILSATVYFDNVSYEDALQILEHAQAYKMELCLRRKPPEYTVQDAEAAQPEGEAGSPKLRGRKTKRQEARISWPKFPSFSKGRKGFKRSHSTSEAEEQRKLEMSPTTSDTESPVKSPLKSPDGKEKKKKRLKLKVKMKGLRSKSVEHPTREEEPTLENLGGVENLLEQNGTDIQSPEEMQLLVEPQVVEQEDAETPESTKARDEYTFPSLAEPEIETGLHKAELITLDKNLKTTDITVALAEGSPKEMRSSESVRTERSELRVNIQGKDLLDTVKESQTRSSPVSIKDQSTSIRTSDPFTYDNTVISPSVISHTDFSDHQFNVDINTPTTTSGRTETTLGHGEMDMSMPKVDVSLDMLDIGLLRKSPRIGAEKQWKDRTVNIPEPESYGIRTRGPLADMATSKVSFDAINGLQFTSSDGAGAVSAQQPDSDLKFKAVISQPKSSTLDINVADKNKDGTVDIKVPQISETHMETSIDKVSADVSITEGKVKAEYKLPKVDISETTLLDPIKLTTADHIRVQLPNREELEIPGMEDATLTAALQIQAMKLPQIEERDTKFADEIQAKRTEIEFNLEDVKALVAKIPTFKLPRIDMSGIHTHKEITPDSDKILATAETPELSEAKTEVSLKLPDDTMEAVMIPITDKKHQDTQIKLPNVELPHFDDHQPITVTQIEDSIQKVKSTMAELKSMTVESKSGDIKYKLPKREDIEIPGMEAKAKTTVQMPDVKPTFEVLEIQKPHISPSHSTDGKIQIPFASAADVDIKGTALISDGKTETLPTDRKDRDKKSKKTKKSMPSFGITKPDIRFPDIGIDLPKQTTIPQKKDDSQVAHTKTESAGDDIKTKTLQAVSLDIQRPEMGIEGLTIEGEIYTSKEEGQIPVPEVNITTADRKVLGTGISLPKVKESGTAVMDKLKTDITMSEAEIKVVAPSADIDSHVTTPEMEAVTQSTDAQGTVGGKYVPESETKDADIKLKKRKISFPKFSFSKTEVKAPEVAITSPKANLPETTMDTKEVEVDGTVPESETTLKDKNITGSPTKFKLPTLKFPIFAMSPQKVPSESTDEESATKLPEDDILEVELPEQRPSVSGKLPSVDLHTIPIADTAVLQSTEGEGSELNLNIPQPKVELSSKDMLISQAKLDELEKAEGLSVEGKIEPPELEIKDEKSFKMPKFGISLPKIKGPDLDISVSKPGIDISLPEGKVDIEQADVHFPAMKTVTDMPKVDVELPTVDGKGASADTDTSVEVEAKLSETKLKKRRISFPKFSFSRSDSKGSDGDGEPLKVDITAAITDVKDSETDIKSPEAEIAAKDKSISSSPTKFKLPTLKFPKFGMSPPKVQTEGIDVDVVNTIPEEEILEVTIQGHDVTISGDVPTKEVHLTSTGDVEAKADVPQIKMETHELDTKSTEGSKIKMPKFGISLPKVKGPEISMSLSKTEGSVSVSEDKSEIQPDVEIKTPSLEAETDMAHLDSKETDIKFKMPKMSFPKFGLAKSEIKATETDVTPKLDISLSDGEVKIKDDSIPQGSLEITSPKTEQKTDTSDADLDIKSQDVELKDSTTLSSSPSKFKLPTFKLPKIGVGTTKVKTDTSELITPEVKLPGVETETTMPVSSKVTAPSIDLSVSAKMPGIMGKGEKISTSNIEIDTHQPQVGIDTKIPEMEKHDIKVSLPKITNEAQISNNLTLPSVDLNISKSDADIKGIEMTSGVSGEANISGKLPSLDTLKSSTDVFPPSVDVALQKSDMTIPSSEVVPPDGKVDVEIPEMSIKDPDGSPFKMPKFGFSLPKVKLPDLSMTGSKPDLDVSVPEGKVEVKVPDSEITVPCVDTELPKAEAKEFDAKMKKRRISFPKFGFSKPDVKAPEVDITLPKVDVSVPEIPESEVKDIKVDVKVPEDTKLKEDTGMTSPKFKLPTFKLPKSGISTSKGVVEGSDIDINVKTPQVSLPETEINISGKVPALDGKGSGIELETPSLDMSLDIKGPEAEAERMKVKSVAKLEGPEVHVSIPKPELDVSLPEGKVGVDVALPQGKVEMPGVDSKGLDVKLKKPSFSFPKFGLSKADVKVPDVDIPEGKVEVTQPDINIKMPEGEAQLKDVNVTSPTKFKLPTIKFPKIGVSAPKGTIEVPTVDVDVKAPEVSLTNADVTISGDVPVVNIKGQGMDIRAPDIEAEMSLSDTEGQGNKFKLPQFGISEVDVSVPKTDLDISLPGGTAGIETPFVEVKGDLPDINLKDTDIKAKKPGFSFPKFGFSKPEVKGAETDVSLTKAEVKEPEIDGKIPKGSTEGKDSKSIDVKMKRPSFSFPKFGFGLSPDVKAPDIDVKVPEVDMPLPEGKVEITEPEIDAEILQGDAKGVDIHTSPSKFKLPTFKLPKIGVSAPKGSVQAPDVDIDIKAPEVTLPDTQFKISGDVQEVALKGQNVSMDSEGAEADGQGSKFKLPNFGISLPTVKGPEMDVSVSKPNVDVSLPEGKMEIDASLPEVKAEIPGVDSKGTDVKVKRPSFSFPKFGWSKTDVKAPDTVVSLPEVDTSLPEGKVEIKGSQIDAKIPEGDVECKDTNIQTSPTKFKLPTLKFPKIGVATPKGLAEAPALDINVKGPEINLPDAELNISEKIPEVDIKDQNVDVQPPSIDVSASTGHEADGQGSKVKPPKFGISLPKVKGPEFDGSVTKPDSDISLNEGKSEINVSLPEGTVETPAVDSKGADVKFKTPSFSFPKFGLSKSNVKALDNDANLPEVDMSVPEGKVETKGPEIEEGHKDLNIHASPTKFKLPTFKLPKIGVAASKGSIETPELDIDVKTPDVTLPQAELKVSGDVPAGNLKSQSIDAEPISTDVHIKAEGLEVQGSKLKLPKFGISLPKVKGPEVDVNVSKPDFDISLPEGKADANISLPKGEIEISGVDSKGADIKMKKPSFSFPKFGFSKPDVKSPEINVNLPEADMSVPEGKTEVKETEVVVQGTEGDIQLKDTSTITSPTKFKLPTFKFPKIGVSAAKGEVNDDVKAPKVSATDAELKASMELSMADVKGQPVDVQTEGHDTEGQEGKFKLPKFGITLPKVKGPDTDVIVSKPDLDASIPEGKIDIEAPSAEVKADIPEIDSKGLDIKTKRPSFTFPKFGLSKPDVKTPHVDVTLPDTDISLPEAPLEVKDPEASVQVADSEVELKDANISGSPSKFKLPTIKFPKFGITAPKVTVEIEHPDTTMKEPDMNVPDLEGKGPSSVTVTDPSVDIKATTTDVNVKTKGVDVEGQESKFKLPKFGIGLPKVKGPEVNVTKTDADITLPEGDIEVKLGSADVERATVKVDLPEVDSKGVDVTVKKPSFSFSKFGFSKSEKVPEVDASLPKTDISLSEVNVDVKEPKPDSEQDGELKAAAISGSPSKFKLPTIKFPKFGVSVPKVELQETDLEVRGQDVPDSELKVSEDTISTDIKVTITQRQDTDADVQTVGVGTDGQGSMFKFPKFGVSLPKVKGSEVKSEGDVSLPEGKVDMEGGVEDLSAETRVDVPDVDVTAKKPGFTFPKFVFSKPDIKFSETDGKTEEADVSKPEGVEIQNVSKDVKSPDRETPTSSPTKFTLPTFKLPTFGGTTVKSTVDIPGDPSLSLGIAEVKHVETNVKEPASEVTPDSGKSDIDAKDVKTRISFPKLVFSKPAVKAPEVDVTLPTTDVTSPEESAAVDVDVKVQETEPKVETAVGGSPSKFKLPTIKLPKFGITTPKTEVAVSEGDSSSVMLSAETDVPVVEEAVAPDTEVSTQSGDSKVLSSPSKFKLPTFKMPRLSLSKAKSEEDAETPSDVKPQEVPLEGDKENTQVTDKTDKTPKFTFSTVQDVLRGFDVEFHVPTLDERDETKGGASQTGEEELKPAASVMEQDVKPTTDVQEKTKSGLQFSKLGLTEASKDDDTRVKTDGTVKESVKEGWKLELKTEQKLQDTKESPEKGSWFKLPKFPSPTKSVKFTEREIATPREDHEQNTESENLENEISITSSVRSSDAFADESSAPTTEQTGSSLTSPTKVTVKYGQSISTGTGDVTANIITSTARTELISMDPDLPEKVNISFSSDSSSMDTLKQEAGAIHIITSNVQAIPDTQKATILSHTVQSLPVEQVIVRTTSTPWSMEETSTMQEDSIVVEKHVIKEMSGESMEKVIITQKMCMLDAESGEPNSNTVASSSQKLRDSVNKEKMLFFESREMPLPAESIVVSSVTTETHVIKHSTEKPHGK